MAKTAKKLTYEKFGAVMSEHGFDADEIASQIIYDFSRLDGSNFQNVTHALKRLLNQQGYNYLDEDGDRIQ